MKNLENVTVEKRDGKVVPFNRVNISVAVTKAVKASHQSFDPTKDPTYNSKNEDVVDGVVEEIDAFLNHEPGRIHVERIQDFVERVLIKKGYADTAKEYILYRKKRDEIRNTRNKTAECMEEILGKDSEDSDLKRDNANINGDTAMGTMLQIGANVSKEYYLDNRINRTAATAHRDGHMHIHDLDFYDLTVTCCQIDVKKILEGGFNTGHGHLREPATILSATALAAISIQSDQNDCHGGQSIPNFDYGLAKYVQKSFKKHFKEDFEKFFTFGFSSYLNYTIPSDIIDNVIKEASEEIFNTLEGELSVDPTKDTYTAIYNLAKKLDFEHIVSSDDVNIVSYLEKMVTSSLKSAYTGTQKETHQAMEAFIHNLNTMHSRAGAQVPFSSINLGTDTSPAGRMVTENLLKALDEGLGNGETAIFPIVIFKVKEGINFNPEDPNYDLFRLSCEVTSRRLFPNFSFIDAPFNKQYYKEGHPETEIAYMGCRTRVIGNNYDPENEITHGRGNLSFTSINLPRLAIESEGSEEKFFNSLNYYMNVAKSQLLERFEIQCKRRVYNFPFLMGQGVWIKSDELKWTDEVREVLKHGTLSIGFVGLAEAMTCLYGHHHGEGEQYEQKALNIVTYMRSIADQMAAETGLNFSLLATPAESLCGRFLRIDRKRFGVIEGVTDKDFYTNSFHIPVNFNISAFDKIRLEAPFHNLTNAGHISYIELDGNVAENVGVIEKIVRCMHDQGIGYGAINHPVDRDPVCGYTGYIGDVCPNCGRRESKDHISFERIRRITGYLVGSLNTWNDAKKAEESMRTPHGLRTTETVD